MKKLLMIFILLMSAQSFARLTKKLNKEVKVFVMNRRGVLVAKGSIFSGSRMEINRNDSLGKGTEFKLMRRGEVRLSRYGFVQLEDVYNDHGSPATSKVMDMLNNDRNLYVSKKNIRKRGRSRGHDFQSNYRHHNNNDNYRNDRRSNRRRNNEIIHDNFNSYNTCYERPYTRWQTRNEKQLKQGQTNTLIGVGIGLFGLALSGSKRKSRRTLGTIGMIGGGALATFGLIQMIDSQSEINHYDKRCRNFYKRDPRPRYPRIRGQRCTTHRFYSNEWGHEVEYFETSCSSRTYYSFEQNHVWRY